MQGIEALEVASERMRVATYVRRTLAVGVVLLAVVLAVTLTRAPPRVVRVGEGVVALLGATHVAGELCQANEVLPAGISAIRLSLIGFFGARVHVTASSGRRLLAEGSRGPEWTGTSVTVGVKPVSHSISNVRLCVDISPNSQPIYFLGSPSSRRDAAILGTGERLGGRVGVAYLASGRSSWWSNVLAVARRMGLGHALRGTWVVLLIAVIMASIGSLAVWITLRELP
jgi:hypothetical protein